MSCESAYKRERATARTLPDMDAIHMFLLRHDCVPWASPREFGRRSSSTNTSHQHNMESRGELSQRSRADVLHNDNRQERWRRGNWLRRKERLTNDKVVMYDLAAAGWTGV